MIIRPWCLVVALVGLTGCPSTVPYKPQEGVLREVDGNEARNRLRETLARAEEPPIVYVDVDDESIRYRYKEVTHGPFGIPTGSVERTKEVFYVNVRSVEIYDNDWVYVYGVGGKRLTKVMFGSSQDARSFADLLMSFRERRVHGMGKKAAPNRAPAPPPSEE